MRDADVSFALMESKLLSLLNFRRRHIVEQKVMSKVIDEEEIDRKDDM